MGWNIFECVSMCFGVILQWEVKHRSFVSQWMKFTPFQKALSGRRVMINIQSSFYSCHPVVTHLVHPFSTMARLSLVALLALAFSGVAFAAPPDSQEVVVVDGVRTAASWSYVDCGVWVLTPEMQPIKLNGDT